jgi:hypothetical protein
MKSEQEALEKAAEYLNHAKRTKTDVSAAMSQARIEALKWAYDFDKDELHEKARELRQ